MIAGPTWVLFSLTNQTSNEHAKCYGSPALASTSVPFPSRYTPFTLLCAPPWTGHTAFRFSRVPPGYQAPKFPIPRRPCPLGRLLPLLSPLIPGTSAPAQRRSGDDAAYSVTLRTGSPFPITAPDPDRQSPPALQEPNLHSTQRQIFP